mmetsp:Transcript_6170/g.14329  ORF Transcript_6170/g.14329 Transcript_6170/m.14329 type:complete len:452 (-) Transcript_6170:77-1432(-)
MALQRTLAALSPKKMMNTHPKNAVRWRPGTPGFWKPFWGASKMKWQFTLPYTREVDSLYHYPEVSAITGKPIDWYHDEPEDGYEALRIFGENTLELKGMPLGRTPEYMQERLRRFFSKFGPVKHCRAEPHPRDPYQCEGKAWITFRDKDAAMKALRAPLKFPASLHDKVVSMRHLETDKCNDPNYWEKSKFWNAQLVTLAKQLHEQLTSDETYREEGKPLRLIGHGLMERELLDLPAPVPAFGRGGVPPSKGLHGVPYRLVPAGPAITRRFGANGWVSFLTEPPFDELFVLTRKDDEAEVRVFPRLISSVNRAKILHKGKAVLANMLHAEMSVWWREGRVQLPDYTQRRMDWWNHKPHLPFQLQIMSRSKDHTRIFDEKYIYRQQLLRARNEKRKERRNEYQEERKQFKLQQLEAKQRRHSKATQAIESLKQSRRLDLSPGLLSAGHKMKA